MDKKTLAHLKRMAGNDKPALVEKPDSSKNNMYQIMESLARAEVVNEYENTPMDKLTDILRYGEPDEIYRLAELVCGESSEPLIDFNMSDQTEEDLDALSRAVFDSLETLSDADVMYACDEMCGINETDKEEMTIQQKMREWSNSAGGDVDDRGHVMDHPAGETIDLSLRRYLDADPMKVSVQEDIKVSDLIREYKQFKGKK